MSDSTLSSFLLQDSEHVMKVVPVPDLKLLLLQGLVSGKAESTLYAFHVSDRQKRWQLSLNEELPGWPSLQSVVDAKACFTCFPEPSLPATEGVYIYDLKKASWLFKNPEFSLIKTEGKELLLRKTGDEDNYYVLNLDSLQVALLPDYAKWVRKVQLSPPLLQGLVYPYHIGEENPLYQELCDFVKELSGHVATGMIEYAEWNQDRILISYYIEQKEGLAQFMLIADKEARLIWQDIIDTGLKGSAMDVFMIFNEQCIYVKNKNQLCIYNLG